MSIPHSGIYHMAWPDGRRGCSSTGHPAGVFISFFCDFPVFPAAGPVASTDQQVVCFQIRKPFQGNGVVGQALVRRQHHRRRLEIQQIVHEPIDVIPGIGIQPYFPVHHPKKSSGAVSHSGMESQPVRFGLPIEFLQPGDSPFLPAPEPWQGPREPSLPSGC